MPYTCPHCGKESEINVGALLGSTTSKAKARAARRNAKLGGWPKGRKRGKRVSPASKVCASNATGPTQKSKDPNVIAHGVVAEAEKLTQQASVLRFPAKR